MVVVEVSKTDDYFKKKLLGDFFSPILSHKLLYVVLKTYSNNFFEILHNDGFYK